MEDVLQRIKNNLEQLKKDNIPFEYRCFCNKYMALIKLENGKKLLFCPVTKKVTYANVTQKTPVNSLKRWLEVNSLTVRRVQKKD